ncbi:MAG: T9SS type A sorting domain-containing protein [Candidatus Poribacteria bacterium]|nr:T9SS type A sorting domain-containing protein [Candidatus Poribacteria bacterium]
MKNKRTFPLLMLIWVSFLFSANAFSQGGGKPDLIVSKMVVVKNGKQIEKVHINNREFRFVATVTNKGAVQSKSTTLRLYRSSNKTVRQDDRKLTDLLTHEEIKVPPLRPKESRKFHLGAKAIQSRGEHYYGAYVVPVPNESKTGNNWFRPVSIFVHGGPGLEPPPTDLISDVAFTPNGTYFVLNAQFLKLMGEGAVRRIYGVCGITLQIPGVQRGAPVQLGNTTDPRLDDPGYFMYQLQPLNVQKEILEDEESRIQNVKGTDWIGIVTGWGGYIVGGAIGGAIGSVIPGAGTAAGVVFGAKIIGGVAGYVVGIAWKAENLANLEDDRKIDILSSTANPTMLLFPHAESRTAPPEISQYLFFIPDRRVRLLPITTKQTFRLADGKERLTATRIVEWNLRETAAAAPHAQPMSLADYPPFQRLSPEAQEHLLRQFGEPTHSEAWRLPETTALLPNYPNPFNPETWIPYQLAKPADVTLTLYDIHGHAVRTLDVGHQRAGVYHSRSRAAYWDGRNAQGEPVASGLYFYTLIAGDFTATRKLLIRK